MNPEDSSFWTQVRTVRQPDQTTDDQGDVPVPDDMASYIIWREQNGNPSSSADFIGNVQSAQPRFAPAPPPRPAMPSVGRDLDPEYARMQNEASQRTVMAHGYIPREYISGQNQKRGDVNG